MNCMRVLPTVIETKGGRFVAAYSRKCQKMVSGIATIYPPTPDEPSFPVALCAVHMWEADTYEPLSEDPENEFCTQCRTYMRPTDRGCEC